ncbi:hypothetical protein [Spirosoma lituiforme]
MDTDTLLNSLSNLFRGERESGLIVDRVGLALAYDGMVGNSYILAVSAPSLAANYDCGDKADTIIDLLFSKFPAEQRAQIDRVRVYDSSQEFERHAKCNFDEQFYGYCEAPLSNRSATRAIA